MQMIPAIDIRAGKCVRLKQGDYHQETVFGEDPVAMARQWVEQGATRLHLVDLDGAREGRPVNREILQSIVEAVAIPCQLGGGLRDECAVQLALEQIGVDRIIVGTRALTDPDWFRAVVARFPGRIALGLDARDSHVATEGWQSVSQVPAIELARRYAEADLAALIYTNIANDGMMQGLDEATRNDLVQLSDLGLPVIASGGVTTLEDVSALAALSREHPNLVGAIIGRALYEGRLQLAEAIQTASRHS